MLGSEYRLDEIEKIVGGNLTGNGKLRKKVVSRIATDSRYSGIDDTTLFFAISTHRDDGHRYLTDAYQRGVRFFAIREKSGIERNRNAIYLEVEKPILALQKLAAFHRSRLGYPILAITGSNGKTSVKEWLFQIVSTTKQVMRSPKSYNSQIGVPLSVMLLPLVSELGIIEAGISESGEMAKLESIVQPDIGLITNVHSAHLENFKDRRDLVNEKLKLFKNCKTIIYRKDYRIIDDLLTNNDQFRRKNLVSWSTSPQSGAAWRVSAKVGKKGSGIKIKSGKKEMEFKIPFHDEASIENAIHCALVSVCLKLDFSKIAPVLQNLPSIAMRLQQLEGINNCTLINDSYNSDLTSLEIALHFLNMQKQHEEKVLILSDISQSGLSASELYKEVNRLCRTNKIDRLIGVGPEIRKNKSAFTIPLDTFSGTRDLLKNISQLALFNNDILIKGSRNFKLEEISSKLEYKKHETTLEINLSAIIENLNYYRSFLKRETKLMIMVKAFSYGTGSYEVANVLQHHGVEYLAVAFVDEGVALRKMGISIPILVLNPAIGGMGEMVKYNLEAEMFSMSSVLAADQFTRKTGEKLKIHLKMESGMHRLGIESGEMAGLIKVLSANKRLQPVSVFSHLVASDSPDFDAFTAKQAKVLTSRYRQLERAGFRKVLRHLINSDGILRFQKYQMDMVRLGIGLYGITSIPGFQGKLKPVTTLKTIISQIKWVKKGESVGYNRAFIASRRTRTATIPVGYADGLARELGNGSWHCRVKGVPAPVIGNICMDMCMLDISDIQQVEEGDEVIVMGVENDAYELAEKRRSIPYEVLTSFSERIKRVYYYGE